VTAPVDGQTKARSVIAGQDEVLGKFKFTSQYEGMMVNDLSILITSSSIATANGVTTEADEVSTVKLFDATTGLAVGDSAGYSVIGSGASSGIAIAKGIGWQLNKNEERTLIVRSTLQPIDINGDGIADSGANLYASIMANGFEAVGATAKDNTITAATGNQMHVLRGKPTITVQPLPSTVLNTNPVVARFRVAAGATPVSFRAFSLRIDPVGATLTAGTTSTITVYDITQDASTAINLGTVVSTGTTAGTGGSAVLGGTTGYVTVYFVNEEEIAANSYSDYDVLMTFNSISGTVGAATLSTKLSIPETSTIANNQNLDQVAVAGNDGNPGFIWSDQADISHSTTTSDWHNGYLLEIPTAQPWLMSN